eukprot:scaffold9439_cov115-Cylindrotheca_fusiformis.AAC.1
MEDMIETSKEEIPPGKKPFQGIMRPAQSQQPATIVKCGFSTFDTTAKRALSALARLVALVSLGITIIL